MKRFFHKDVLFSTLFVFLVMYLLRLFIFNIEFLNPIANALRDFKFTDIYYSRFHEKDPIAIDTNIVLVNIGYNSRAEIASQLAVINQFDPAVIGLDVTFESPKDPFVDSVLAGEIRKADNIVMAAYFSYSNPESERYDQHITSNQLFRNGLKEGYINFPAKETENTIRHFSPWLKYYGEKYFSFPVQIVSVYDPAAFSKLLNRESKAERIAYRGNMEFFISLETDDIYPSNPMLNVLKDKIVLMGFLGPDLNTRVLEDIHFTPLNHKYSGRSYPDMYGVVIHANIINTILQGEYIVMMPLWLSLLISFILTYMAIYFFIRYYLKWKIWYQVIVRSLQLGISIIIVAIELIIYKFLNFKLDAVIIVVPILLSIDVLEIYESIIRYLNKKFKVKTWFAENH